MGLTIVNFIIPILFFYSLLQLSLPFFPVIRLDNVDAI